MNCFVSPTTPTTRRGAADRPPTVTMRPSPSPPRYRSANDALTIATGSAAWTSPAAKSPPRPTWIPLVSQKRGVTGGELVRPWEAPSHATPRVPPPTDGIPRPDPAHGPVA